MRTGKGEGVRGGRSGTRGRKPGNREGGIWRGK